MTNGQPGGQRAFVAGQYIPRGDGTFIFRPSIPVRWVGITDAAKLARVSRRTMVRWVASRYVQAQRRGPKLWEVEVSSLPNMAVLPE